MHSRVLVADPGLEFRAKKSPAWAPGGVACRQLGLGSFAAENEFTSTDDFENLVRVKATRSPRISYDRGPPFDPAADCLVWHVGEPGAF